MQFSPVIKKTGLDFGMIKKKKKLRIDEFLHYKICNITKYMIYHI